MTVLSILARVAEIAKELEGLITQFEDIAEKNGAGLSGEPRRRGRPKKNITIEKTKVGTPEWRQKIKDGIRRMRAARKAEGITTWGKNVEDTTMVCSSCEEEFLYSGILLEAVCPRCGSGAVMRKKDKPDI
jgi:predicted RNA-binding Zn-ribbon protein involved in translation (DUF1610 family)